MLNSSIVSSASRSGGARMRTPARLDNGIVNQNSVNKQGSMVQNSHSFLQHSAVLEQLATRLEHRTAQRDEATQIAIKAADADAALALDAARYFRDIATVQTN